MNSGTTTSRHSRRSSLHSDESGIQLTNEEQWVENMFTHSFEDIPHDILHPVMQTAGRVHGSETRQRPLYTLQCMLGRGGYGIVFRVTEERSRNQYALKVLRRRERGRHGDRKDVTSVIVNEIQIHSLFIHPNIVRLFDAFMTRTHAFMVMELADGSLSDPDQRRMSETRAARLLRGVVTGLDHCHRMGVVYRDMKTDNILLKDGVPKLTDFGLSCRMGDDRNLGVPCGTRGYRSPESVNRQAEMTTLPKAGDYYSLGITLHVMIFGAFPRFNTRCLLRHVTIPNEPRTGRLLPKLLDGLLHANPRKRFDVARVTGHRWMTELAGTT